MEKHFYTKMTKDNLSKGLGKKTTTKNTNKENICDIATEKMESIHKHVTVNKVVMKPLKNSKHGEKN